MTSSEQEAITKLGAEIIGKTATQLKPLRDFLEGHLKAIEALKSSNPGGHFTLEFFSQIQPSEELAKAALKVVDSVAQPGGAGTKTAG
jgi:hypothetical protein